MDIIILKESTLVYGTIWYNSIMRISKESTPVYGNIW
nr:MAG TPA: hypothetical protein [Caudoviricetes sp.]DAU22353.1 MAG TPA: hypothetical protein [Caudoviricetes sp.]